MLLGRKRRNDAFSSIDSDRALNYRIKHISHQRLPNARFFVVTISLLCFRVCVGWRFCGTRASLQHQNQTFSFWFGNNIGRQTRVGFQIWEGLSWECICVKSKEAKFSQYLARLEGTVSKK